MKKQEIISTFKKQLAVENYAEQIINNYLSALKLFLDYIEKLKTSQITEKEIQNYLYYCKTEKKICFFYYEANNLLNSLFIFKGTIQTDS